VSDTLIDFIRHGEPVGGRRYRGDGADDPLSEKGWQQMWRAVGDQAPWSRVISSPLQRCHAFAQALQQRYELPVEVDRRFREVGLGSWEGRTPDEVIADNEAEYQAFYDDPRRNRPDGSEPLELFGQRVAEALEAASCDYAGEHLLVVAHAGVIRAAVGHVLQADPVAWYRVRVDNASFTRVSHDGRRFRLEFHNRTVPVYGIET
jgi:probable phosphoglycerate mutase